MAEKPKPKAKPKRKSKFTDKAQSERFIEAARAHSVEEVGPQFDDTFKSIARARLSKP